MRGRDQKDKGQREDNFKPGLLLAGDTLILEKIKYSWHISAHFGTYYGELVSYMEAGLHKVW